MKRSCYKTGSHRGTQNIWGEQKWLLTKKHCSVHISLRLNWHRGDYMGSDTTAHSARHMLLNISKCHNLPVVQQPWHSPEEKMDCQRNGFSHDHPALQESTVSSRRKDQAQWSHLAMHVKQTGLRCPQAPSALQVLWELLSSLLTPQKNAWFWLALIPASPADWLLPWSQAGLLKGSPHIVKVSVLGGLPRGGHLSDCRGTRACTVLLTGFMCDTEGTVMDLGYLSKLTACCLTHGDRPLSSEMFYDGFSNFYHKFKNRITALRCTLLYGQGGLRSMWTFLYLSSIQ